MKASSLRASVLKRKLNAIAYSSGHGQHVRLNCVRNDSINRSKGSRCGSGNDAFNESVIARAMSSSSSSSSSSSISSSSSSSSSSTSGSTSSGSSTAAAAAAATAAAQEMQSRVQVPVYVDPSQVLVADPGMMTLRNLGISAHIDSGKTTLTERILFYSGRINKIHEVKGKDGVGALMDSMDLERERGITIQSAATFAQWKGASFNIVDTPGHVDFTVEVERALRVLDGAVLVLCGVAGIQSQSVTVDRQMKRYNVPRLAFINKLDRAGANPWPVIDGLRSKLKLNAAAVQIPIGLESDLKGLIDLVNMRAIGFEGTFGEKVVDSLPIPDDLMEEATSKRMELIETLADVDDEIGDLFLTEQDPTAEQLQQAIRRCTLQLTFVPVFMGSAFKNRGVQPLLDGVVSYLPSPAEMRNFALDASRGENKFELTGTTADPLVAFAFKLEEGKFGQLTYMRIYQGTLRRGMTVRNVSTGKKVKVPRLVRMHADSMEDVEYVGAGEVCAIFGVDCSSGDTFADTETKNWNPTMMSMFVPEPVMSLAISPKDRGKGATNFSKALQRFTKEDPTLRIKIDPESKETIMSGMGELHLDVYVERMRREYGVEVVTGAPKVNYRETVTRQADFDYLHKKQTGGSGQYGKVIGHIEPLDPSVDVDENGNPLEFEFVNEMMGNAIPPEYIQSVEEGFRETMAEGALIGAPVTGVRAVLTDGQSHAVDSSEFAFRAAARGAFLQAFRNADPCVLEPIMHIVVEVPDEYQGTVVGGLNKRRGVILDTQSKEGNSTISAEVPLGEMFSYATDIRSATQAKGEYSMTYSRHARLVRSDQDAMVEAKKKADAEALKHKRK